MSTLSRLVFAIDLRDFSMRVIIVCHSSSLTPSLSQSLLTIQILLLAARCCRRVARSSARSVAQCHIVGRIVVERAASIGGIRVGAGRAGGLLLLLLMALVAGIAGGSQVPGV